MNTVKSSVTFDMKTTSSGEIKITNWNKAKVVMTGTFIVLTLLTIYGFLSFDYKEIDFIQASIATLDNLKLMFLQANLNNFTLAEAVYQIGLTLGLAFLATIIGAVLSLFIA